MPSFHAQLAVGSFKSALDSFILDINQDTDSLGRPSSPVFAGKITMAFNTSADPLLAEWMFSPSKQLSGTVTLRELEGQTLKTITFSNAYCIDMEESFDGTANSAKMTTTITISPEKITVGQVQHDNDWALIEYT